MSINIIWDDFDMLKELYDEIIKQNNVYDEVGINFEDFKKILAKKKKDEDIEADLLDAFKFLASCKKQPKEGEEIQEGKETESFMNSEEFRDWLVYNGYRYNEEQADAFMNECDPKKEGFFNYEDLVCKKIVKRDVKKKKGGME